METAEEPLPQRVRKRGRKSRGEEGELAVESAAAEDGDGSQQEVSAEPVESDNLSSTFASEAEREATLAAAQSIFARPKQYECTIRSNLLPHVP